MEKIDYSILEDLKYYNKSYNKEDWEYKELKDFMKFYTDNNIQIDVTTWIRLNECEDKMIYKESRSNQICFIRDDIGEMFFNYPIEDSLEASKLHKRNIMVDSTHFSKSIELPVYKICANGKDDLVITISDNFYSYQVSVESKNFDIDLDFKKLFDIEKIPDFMYGFKEEKIFKPYIENKRKFSFSATDKYYLYTIMYQISELWKENLKI